jgi:hypothetical protein
MKAAWADYFSKGCFNSDNLIFLSDRHDLLPRTETAKSQVP